MPKLDNIKLKNVDDKPLYLEFKTEGSADNVKATTLSLLRTVMNSPYNGENGQGQQILGYQTMEDFKIGSRIFDKLTAALKQDKSKSNSGEGIESFELSQDEYEFARKFIKLYKPVLASAVWAPFVNQFFPD